MESVIAFWKELIRNPRRVGSISPSGAALGAAMIKVVLADKPGCVVELGAGKVNVEHSRVDYDVERAMRGIGESELPDDFAEFLKTGNRP